MSQPTILPNDELRPLRVLMVEDSEYDAELMLETLKQGGFEVYSERVDTAEDMLTALNAGTWDIILSDYSMPQFSGPDALEILRTSGQDIPFIIVSGTIGEEVAVNALKSGAQDFFLKGKMMRLVPAVQRELKEEQNRRELKTIEQRMLSTFEQAAVGIAQVSPEGKWLRLNRKYCEILGYNQEELIGKYFQDMTPPEEVGDDIEYNQRLISGEIDHYVLEKRYIRKDGSLVWVNLMVSLAKDEKQMPLYSIAVAEDITEKKKAKEALQRTLERERFASEIIDGIRSETELDMILYRAVNGIGELARADRCAVWLHDPKTKQFQIPDFNREYCSGPQVAAISGVLPKCPDIEHSVISDVPVFPYALGCTQVINISDVFAVMGLTEHDHKIIQARGIKSLLHVPILYNEQFLGAIRVHSVLKQRVWDEETILLTELIAARLAVAIYHARTLQELKDSEARKSGILDSSLDAVITIDHTGGICEWNASAERILGYRREEVLGQDIGKLIIPERYRMAHYRGIMHFLATGEGPALNKPLELPALKADGSEFLSEISIATVSVAGPPMFTGILRDITDRKRAEQELKTYAAKLEESNQDLEHFATIASHDLQAPLRKVQMFSAYLQESIGEKLSDKEHDYIVRMQRAILKMQNLIDDLLDLSRVTRKGKPFVKTDLRSLVEEILLDLQPMLNEKDGRVEVGEMVIASVDSTQMQSLLFNLLQNALKFHRKGVPPIVRVSAFPLDGHYYELVVSDNGIGIKEKYFHRIFEIFSRLHGESVYPGTGIGLALSKKIAERHHGSILVDSKPGVGSTFRVRLPFQPSKIPKFENIL